MSGKGDQGDLSLSAVAFFMILLAVLVWAVYAYSAAMLVPWKALRLVELALSFQWGLMIDLWNANITTYDRRFDYVNDRVWIAARFLAIPMGYFAFKALKNAHFLWQMDDHLQVLYGRFKWLHMIMTMPRGFVFRKKFPFFIFEMAPTFLDVYFPEGEEPLDYFEKYRDVLPEKLKNQIGPLIKTKDKKIVWQDKNAEKLVMECYKRIPDKRPLPNAPSWREQAWTTCVQNHRYERTFALGMLAAARRFGVMSAVELLELRRQAGFDIKNNKDYNAFFFWRAVISFGGRCVYSEGAGIICHYYFECGLTDYLTQHPEDKQVAHYLRAQPWIKNALDSFFDVYNTVMNAPDVESLRKAGLLKR